MFVSAYSGLPPMLWSSEQLAANLYNGSGLDPAAFLSTMTAAAAGAGAGAGMDPEKRPQGLAIPSSTAASFFISDILYPSVIPLPGTLPHTSPGGHGTTAATTSPPPPPPPSSTMSPSPDPPSPIVPPRASVIVLQPRSRDLKFGIDRILSATTTTKGAGSTGVGVGAGASRLSPQMSPAEADAARKKEKHATDSRSAGAQVSSSDSSPASVLHRSPPTTMPPCSLPPATTCPCSSPTCTTPLRHPHHPHHHHPPPHHLSFHPLAGFGGTDGRGGMGQGQGGLRLPPPHPHAPHPHHPPPGVPHHPALYPHPPPPHHHHHQRDLFHRTPSYPGPYGVLGGSSEVTSNGGTQSPAKRKRSWSRAVFSNLQRKGLEKRFEVQKYVTKPDRRQLAAMLGLTDAQVKVWFQNRRMKWRHAEEQKKKRTAGDGDDEATDGKKKSPGEENKSAADEETGGEVEVSEVLSLHEKDDDDDEDLDGEMSLEIDVESCQESDDEETEMTLTLHEKLTS